MTNKATDEIERLKSEIELIDIARESFTEGFDLLKKFLTVFIDETFPGECMDVISNSDKITQDEIIKVFQLLDIKNVNVIGE